MKIVAALTDPADAPLALRQGADMAELRFDLMDADPAACVRQVKSACPLPLIGTLRSVAEGGRFAGDAGDWIRKIRPVVSAVDFIDIEQRFSQHARIIRDAGCGVIASYHTGAMPTCYELFDLERQLRTYGDIVKIIVTPQDEEDIIDLITFTHAAELPVCTGVMGTEFRFARALLPLFGSELAYCSVGKATAEGQYTVAEFRQIQRMLGR
jgi:3-dehydroquinate dehydratase-1